jgi:hypothetical protein
MVAEQLPDNSELRVDVLLEEIESYRGLDVLGWEESDKSGVIVGLCRINRH